jgi:hypothetical protein
VAVGLGILGKAASPRTERILYALGAFLIGLCFLIQIIAIRSA